MKHVLIDRPRTGGDGGKSHPPKGSKKRLQKTPLEEQSNFQSNARGRVYGYDCKQPNDHLGPLRRWLQSQVGRNWDDVWSEVCENLSASGVMTKHVRDHAQAYVEQNCTIDDDGNVCDSRGTKLSGYWSSRQFYVDPRDNILRVLEAKPRWRRQYKQDWIEGKDENHRYYLLKGVWYEVKFEPFPHARPRPKWWERQYQNHTRVHDMVIAANWNRKDKKYNGSDQQHCESYYGSAIYAAKKVQLGKREIRKLKLWERYQELHPQE